MTNTFNITHKKILPSETTYQELYRPLGITTKGQNIWFLIWILKQIGCDVYLNEIILSAPFSINRHFVKQIASFELYEIIMLKNGLRHGYCKLYGPIGTYSLVVIGSKWIDDKDVFKKIYIRDRVYPL